MPILREVKNERSEKYRMKGIRVYIQPHGYIENDLAWNILNPRLATVNNKKVVSEWLAFPTFSVLIEHPEMGWILYDTGSHPDVLKNRLPEEARSSFLYVAKNEDFLDARLKSIGLIAQDIKTIIISHLHWDHVGGLYLFAGTIAGSNVLVGEEDFKHALFVTHISQQKFVDGYLRDDFELPGITYHPIKEDTELAKGIEIISLSGHTPQILGLVVHLEHTGTIVFTSDAFSMRENFGPPPRLPGIIYDSRAFYATFEKVWKIKNKYHAEIVHPHDPNQFSTLRISPAYYD